MKYLLSCLALFLTTSVFASDENIASALQEESDFQSLSAQMKEKSLGLVLMFHAEFCPYCAQMENDILSPMVRSKEYDSRVFIRKLQIDEARDVVDFLGKTVEPSDISDRYNASMTPTLVFLDYKGDEKATQMVGINTVELFNAYLENEIDTLKSNIDADIKKLSVEN